jgi:hypothetical protein
MAIEIGFEIFSFTLYQFSCFWNRRVGLLVDCKLQQNDVTLMAAMRLSFAIN